jgi:hypothetical protein
LKKELTHFKFYHGTSTIFLSSIQKHGLGTINPNLHYKNLDVLRYLYKEAEKYLQEELAYQRIRTTTYAMANQTFFETVINESGDKHTVHFRHDNIYVALSQIRAIIYALSNKYGSEILDRCITLYKLLNKHINDFSIPEEINAFKIETYIDMKPEPIIVEASNIDDDDLGKEDGKTAKEALDLLRESMPYMTEKEKYEFLQYCNFELLKPVLPEKLKFFKLFYSGHPSNQQTFTWKLAEL